METRFDEARHPIGVAAERTGVSTELIRAWERRYGATEPARGSGGQRLYSDADLERLSLLRRATEGGRSIGQVARLSQHVLSELVRGDEAARAERREWTGEDALAGAVDDLEAEALALAGDSLERALRDLLLELGFVPFVEEVAAPLLRRLGDGWHAGRVSPAQEHLASAAVRRVLDSARDVTAGRAEEGHTAVVSTFPGERHEAGALVVAAAAGLAGWRVVYLGADLPVAALAEAALETGARAVCVSVTLAGAERDIRDTFRALRTALPSHVEVYAGGPAVAADPEMLEGFGVLCPPSLSALTSALRRQATTPPSA